ncbi:acireductone synthase [Xylella taiwanensis]|uniref:Enolase-phosphatase E1 n=1 Tax=Xylella taiwanensis TaxID=1444770 RepID=Z9JKG1_9GAMM|nr:acireductone synthase [Xylella taiwanensis]AXI83730.1 haloacid dehalogenase [Xylella taiwanensis]EWS78242.1 haloacid dehalogenase [Xylella taiwanensis]MCD8456833.1 acireductone synthase [Xylella taiwanensis]MCD8459242.1 acireductone synthase [Xylella taiwanensis]MCD8461885.1 acireductone synthase [Xylella taiwanensis]
MDMPHAIVTDIEGTTSSISFVKDVLFAYARRALPDFIHEHRGHPDVKHWLNQVIHDSGQEISEDALVTTLQSWIDEDRKHTALKALQGMIWASGYQKADFTAPIYPDAAERLRAWHAAKVPLYVYSSGSVPAQQLFFSHSNAGDLSGLFSGWFDTETGGKREHTSYQRIAKHIGIAPAGILFLSDVIAELDAAAYAGMKTVLIDRREDYPTPRNAKDAGRHMHLESFAQLPF